MSEIMALAKITVTNAHGTFTAVGSGLDLAMMRYLPASPSQLRELMQDVAPENDYSDVDTCGEFLVMLADVGYPRPYVNER